MDRFLIVLCLIIVSSSADDDLVQIEDGKIQGTYTTNLDGEPIYSFLGIPYAQPPKDDLRFKDPLPVKPWNGTFDASEMGECCFQEGFIGSENCLNLNVHTKEPNPTELKPVMVWIHGGSFISGSNQAFGPDFLLIEDIVLVAINYRLGILGFLSLENATLEVSGNAGLKDQALALKWVQKNIQHFGGDPKNVTIFGESAGAASVHYHVVSEASRGLFHKAIIQSGSVLNPWATVDRQLAMKFGDFIKLENFTEDILLKRLREYSVREIYEHQEKFLKAFAAIVTYMTILREAIEIQKHHNNFNRTEGGLQLNKAWLTALKNSALAPYPHNNGMNDLIMTPNTMDQSEGSPSLSFGPVIENPNNSPFITESGLDILKSGKYNKVPIMMGYCSNEGLLLEIEKKKMIVNDTVLKNQESFMEVVIPLDMNLQMNQSWGSHINREFINIYFKGTNANNKYLLSTDYYFVSGILGSAELHASTSQNPVYLYRMSLDAGRNLLKRLAHLQDFPGVCHADDLGYLFNIKGLEMGQQEEQYVRTFVKLWTNFAKYGNPTPNGTDLGIEWKPLDKNQYFVDIGENLTLRSKPEKERMSIWQEIYPDIQVKDDASSLLSSLIPTFLFLILCMDI